MGFRVQSLGLSLGFLPEFGVCWGFRVPAGVWGTLGVEGLGLYFGVFWRILVYFGV